MSTHPADQPRFAALDVLRGTAILGTLATNIWIFTNPEGLVGYVNNSTAAVTPAGWAGVEAVLQHLAQGKFLGLLTLMFGIGLEIQHRSAVRHGRRWPGRYPWRAGLLLVDGLLNYFLVVEFDVLMGYAITAVVVAYLLARSERAQRRWLIAAAGVHLALLGLITVALVLAPVSAQPTRRPNPYADGSWLDLVAFRVDNFAFFRSETVFIGALSVAMFLAGAELVRRGVLEPRGRTLRQRLIVIGSVALVADLTIGLAGGPAGLVFGRYGTAPVVAFGLLAAVVTFVEARPVSGFLRRRLVEVGRMALSCYVAQNLIASVICYGWGLGLAGRLSAADRVPVTVAVYAGVAVLVCTFAHLWLRWFDRGPVELAWLRCFAAINGAMDKAIPARSEPAIPPERSPSVSR